MFKPVYSISARLLANLKHITELTVTLNGKRFSRPILLELERTAREISAHASTSIEGNPLPLTEVKKILQNRPSHIRDTEREVLNYNTALTWLDGLAKKKEIKFDMTLILQIHKKVMENLLLPQRCGEVRNKPVFVNDPHTRKTVYWPPDHADAPQLLNDLFAFTKNEKEKVDPLILAGIFHKQFVIVHPFMDGNGRTVRLATKVLLAAMGLNTFNLFSFENYYNKNVAQYFKNVGVQGNYYDIQNRINFTAWLEYFTDGIIDELLRVSKILDQKNVTPETILRPHHHCILEYIQKHGFITDKIYSGLTDRAKPTRNLDFNKLIAMGLIERVGKGKATLYRLR